MTPSKRTPQLGPNFMSIEKIFTENQKIIELEILMADLVDLANLNDVAVNTEYNKASILKQYIEQATELYEDNEL
jgi:hypothetical protein